MSITGTEKTTQLDARYHVYTKSTDQAQVIFTRAVNNLLTINKWHELAGRGAIFQLVNQQGVEIDSTPQKLDFIRIEPSGMPTAVDPEWVQIERIDYYKTSLMEAVVVRAKPATSPTSGLIIKSRYFTPDSTNNFTVERLGKKVTASVHVITDKNLPGPRTAGNRSSKSLSIFKSLFGINRSQWKSLVKGMIKRGSHSAKS